MDLVHGRHASFAGADAGQAVLGDDYVPPPVHRAKIAELEKDETNMSEQNDELERLTEESRAYPAEGLVTIAELPDPASANMARMVLDTAGITSFLQGENANNLIPGAFSARLQV